MPEPRPQSQEEPWTEDHSLEAWGKGSPAVTRRLRPLKGKEKKTKTLSIHHRSLSAEVSRLGGGKGSMPATEEFPEGPAGRQIPAPVLQMEGKGPTRLHVQSWETAFWTEGYAGAKAGE